MESEEDKTFDILCQFADQVIFIEKVDQRDEYRKKMVEICMKQRDEFFKQVDQRLSECDNENDRSFVKETTTTFLISSLQKIIVDYDCPDENIDYLASIIKEQIESCKIKK